MRLTTSDGFGKRREKVRKRGGKKNGGRGAEREGVERNRGYCNLRYDVGSNFNRGGKV